MPRLRGMIRLFRNGEEIGSYFLSGKRKFKIPNTEAYIVAKRVTDEEGCITCFLRWLFARSPQRLCRKCRCTSRSAEQAFDWPSPHTTKPRSA